MRLRGLRPLYFVTLSVGNKPPHSTTGCTDSGSSFLRVADMFGYHDTRPHAEHVSALYVRDLGLNHQDGLQVDQLTAAQPLMPNTAPLDFGALQQLDLDFFGINPQLFNEPVVATGGLLPAAAPPLPHAHPYGAPVAAPHTARQLRCLDPTHAAGCTRCVLRLGPRDHACTPGCPYCWSLRHNRL